MPAKEEAKPEPEKPDEVVLYDSEERGTPYVICRVLWLIFFSFFFYVCLLQSTTHYYRFVNKNCKNRCGCCEPRHHITTKYAKEIKWKSCGKVFLLQIILLFLFLTFCDF